MRKPRIAIAAYNALRSAQTRWRAERAIRRIVPFDRLPPSVRDRVVVSRRRVLEGRRFVHHAPGATPVDQPIATGDLHLTILRDVLVDVYYGFARTRDGWILEETSVGPPGIHQKLRNGQLLRPTRILPVDRAVMNLECGPKNANFFHFWLESLTKLLWVGEQEVSELGPLFLAHSRELAKWQREIVLAAIPPNVRLLRVERDTLIDAKEYVDLPAYRGDALDPDSLERLRSWSRSLPQGARSTGHHKRIYISRRKARWRRVLNEAELEELLRSFGYVSVVLEDLPVGDQIALFERADSIVAQHGAGLTHLLHTKPGTHVLEIHSGSPSDARRHYRSIAASVGADYANVFCHGPGAHLDAEVPLDELRVWLDAHSGPDERS